MSKVSDLKANIGGLVSDKYQLRSALQALYDDCADYIKINNLYRADGKSAIWNQTMRDAKKALKDTKFTEVKP